MNGCRTLSDRERQIFKLISEGYIAKEVAEKLSLSINTIETVKKNVCHKLNAKNTPHAVRIALEIGEID